MISDNPEKCGPDTYREVYLSPASERIRSYINKAHMQPEYRTRITIDDAQCGGRPCIRGMRIRVSDILELLGSGASIEEILEDYPYLEREDILASIQYAALQTGHPILKIGVKFLIDNQLPPALARFIETDFGHPALHVVDIGMRDASDAEVWSYASEPQLVLISKDEDFAVMALRALG